jgi:hypothetical protein
MPYIDPRDRPQYEDGIQSLIYALSANKWHPGHMNYCFFKIVKACWQETRSYTAHAKIVGMLTDVRDEFKRRFGHDYEDSKIKENGDV